MKREPVVTIYVRHKGGCPLEGKNFARGCDCPKWLRYSLNGKQRFVSTGTRSWGRAEELREETEKALRAGTAPAATTAEAPKVLTVSGLVQDFLAAKESENLTISTRRKLTYQLRLFEEFLADRGRLTPASITPKDVLDFRASWTSWSDLTRIKAQQNLRGFIRFATSGDHRTTLLDVLGTIKETREGKQRRKPKPLTEHELQILLAQIPTTFADEPHKIPLVTAFVRGAVSLGLACVDMVQLEKKRVLTASNGILEIERHKTGRKASPRIDPSVRAELLAVTNGNPKYVFWNGTSLPSSAAGQWQGDLRRLFQDANLWIKGDLSHRFRDTAVDFWLGAGYSLTDVAAMIGDTLTVVERHYADLASNRMAERLLRMPARTW